MVPPLTFVVNVHSLLALTGGRGHRTITVDDRFLKEGLRLLLPHLNTNVVDGIHQNINVVLIEPPTEIAGRGRVGDTLCPEGIKINLIIATQLDVFQTLPSG